MTVGVSVASYTMGNRERSSGLLLPVPQKSEGLPLSTVQSNAKLRAGALPSSGGALGCFVERGNVEGVFGDSSPTVFC